MALSELTRIYQRHSSSVSLLQLISDRNNKKILCSGLLGSSKSLLTAALTNQIPGIHLIILPEKEDAAYFYNDLVNLMGSDKVLFFPSSYKRSIHYNQIDHGNIILRTYVINTLASVGNNRNQDTLVIVTYTEGLAEKVITHKRLKKNTLHLIKGEKISISFIQEVLEEYHFTQVDFVYEPGQYAIRGSLVDVFSFANSDPYRIDFFGDEVESIRTFDIDNQLSKDTS